MSDEQFKLGDVVRHKSGTGPAMVVIEIKGEDEGMALNCEWVDDFGGTEKPQAMGIWLCRTFVRVWSSTHSLVWFC